MNSVSPYNERNAVPMLIRLVRWFAIISGSIFLLIFGYSLNAILGATTPTRESIIESDRALWITTIVRLFGDSATIALFLGVMFTLIVYIEYRRQWSVRYHRQRRPIRYDLSAEQSWNVGLSVAACQQLLRQFAATYPDVMLQEMSGAVPRMKLYVAGETWFAGETIHVELHAIDAIHTTVQLISRSLHLPPTLR